MNRRPISNARSHWHLDEDDVIVRKLATLGVRARIFHRNVHDGQLRALVAEEPDGWHLSISHAPTPRKKSPPRAPRYPTWDELADARYGLLPDDIDAVMHLPPSDEYVAVHDTTFHLHEHPPRSIA